MNDEEPVPNGLFSTTFSFISTKYRIWVRVGVSFCHSNSNVKSLGLSLTSYPAASIIEKDNMRKSGVVKMENWLVYSACD